MSNGEHCCPGCGLALPSVEPRYEGYFHASKECWSVFLRVLAKEYANAALFADVHQLSVDAYAAQHAGGEHPDKSVDVHLVGLQLALERGIRPNSIPSFLQRLAGNVGRWPHFAPPAQRAEFTTVDVALAVSPLEHAARVREWSRQVWGTWSEHHDAIRALAEACFAPDGRATAGRER